MGGGGTSFLLALKAVSAIQPHYAMPTIRSTASTTPAIGLYY